MCYKTLNVNAWIDRLLYMIELGGNVRDTDVPVHAPFHSARKDQCTDHHINH